jgi:hypothetical protein
LLARNEGLFSQEEVKWVTGATRGVLAFFAFICQYLFVQSWTFSLIDEFLDKDGESKGEAVAFYLWIYVVYCPSQLLMIYGISSSIKKASKYEVFELNKL